MRYSLFGRYCPKTDVCSYNILHKVCYYQFQSVIFSECTYSYIHSPLFVSNIYPLHLKSSMRVSPGGSIDNSCRCLHRDPFTLKSIFHSTITIVRVVCIDLINVIEKILIYGGTKWFYISIQ